MRRHHRTRFASYARQYPGLAEAITLKPGVDPEEELDDAIEEFIELLTPIAEREVDSHFPKYKLLKLGPISEDIFYVSGGQVYVEYPRTISWGRSYTVPFEPMLAEVQRKIRFTFKQSPEFFQDVFKIVTEAYQRGVPKSDLEPTHPDEKEKIVSKIADMDVVKHDTSYDDEDDEYGGLVYDVETSLWDTTSPPIKFTPAPKGMKVEHVYNFQVKVKVTD